MKRSLREILASYHISAIAIAVLLLWSINSGIQALCQPLYWGINLFLTAVTILDIPRISGTLSFADRITLIIALSNLFISLTSLAAAWLLSRWVYGVGPFSCLRNYRTGLSGRNHD